MRELTAIETKVLNQEELSEDELEELLNTCDEVIRIEHDKRRWSRLVEVIFKLDNRFFNLTFDEGLTENQIDGFDNQPFEVERVEEVVTEIRVEYRPKKKKRN